MSKIKNATSAKKIASAIKEAFPDKCVNGNKIEVAMMNHVQFVDVAELKAWLGRSKRLPYYLMEVRE